MTGSMTPTSTVNDNNDNNGGGGVSPTQAKIIGGVVGGIVGLILLGALVFMLVRRSKKKKEAVDFETFNPQRDDDDIVDNSDNMYSPTSSHHPHWSQSQNSNMNQPLTH